jgi:hypothetical protein
MKTLFLMAVLALVVVATGCEKKESAPPVDQVPTNAPAAP